jgi:hypothetical protein
MNDQCCGTCRWWGTLRDLSRGFALRTCVALDGKVSTFNTDGANCSLHERKERDDSEGTD